MRETENICTTHPILIITSIYCPIFPIIVISPSFPIHVAKVFPTKPYIIQLINIILIINHLKNISSSLYNPFLIYCNNINPTTINHISTPINILTLIYVHTSSNKFVIIIGYSDHPISVKLHFQYHSFLHHTNNIVLVKDPPIQFKVTLNSFICSLIPSFPFSLSFPSFFLSSLFFSFFGFSSSFSSYFYLQLYLYLNFITF